MTDRERQWADAMRAANRGDGAAYAALLRDMAGALRMGIRHRLAAYGFDQQEAEDIVQEVLLGIHQKRDTWDEGRPIVPWVYAIARYKTLDASRRLGRTRRLQVSLSFEDWTERLEGQPAPDVAVRLDTQSLLAALPRRQRMLVQALTLEGDTVRHVAERFAMSEGAVRVAFHRGLKRLSAMADTDQRKERMETGSAS